MNDLIDFFKNANKKNKKGPRRTTVITRGPAVTTCVKVLKNGFPLIQIVGAPYNMPGQLDPAVRSGRNDNNTEL